MCPEILQGKKYNEKCDIWSCAVVIYLMIVGYPPFFGKTKQEIIQKITSGYIDYSDDIWDSISPECKNLLSQMFVQDPDKRISASDVMKSPWIAKVTTDTKVTDVDLRLSLSNLRNFRTQIVFQGAVLSYIASQKMTQKEEAKIRQIFDVFDADKDGQLSRKELLSGLRHLYGDDKRAKKETEAIFKNIDLNNNGFIEYNGIYKLNNYYQFI